jgi:hypothetical protein
MKGKDFLTNFLFLGELTCNISMIFNLVSMTRGYPSLLSSLVLFCTLEGSLGPIPEAPNVRPVTTAPMSPIDRRTPPSAGKIK